MGAWIETITELWSLVDGMVAPYVGAWIETLCPINIDTGLRESHPTWVRGLKPLTKQALRLGVQSHPTWVRGLKLTVSITMREARGRTLRGCVD